MNEQNAAIEIFQGKDDQYYFRIRIGGDILYWGEGYTKKQGASRGLRSTIRNGNKYENWEKRETRSEKKKVYYVLKAKNGAIVGRTRLVEPEQAIKLVSSLHKACEGVVLIADRVKDGRKK